MTSNGRQADEMIALTSSPSPLFDLVVYHFACRLFLITQSYIIRCIIIIFFCLIKLPLVHLANPARRGGF